MQLINKDPTEKYQKKIQQAIKGANSVTSVTAYVILYSYIQVHKLVQIKSK